jgi:structural maintenance of chromosomes protein 5
MAPEARRRKRPAVHDDSESQTEGSAAATEISVDEYDSESSRRSRPRRRMEDADDGDAGINGTLGSDGPSHHSDAHHKPGAVVRVQVRNFGTYSAGEFFPGPYLNMVLGPNGTGKSTLGRALCIGLAFPHKLLANADSVSAFVKHGEDAASIEIELKRLPNEARNPIIRVKLNKDNNSQKFWLNGKEVPKKRIEQLAKRFNIQIDNVCQFLPQERVAEFAKLSDVDLLHEMLRAAASNDVVAGHRQLKELYESLESYRTRVREDEDRVEKLDRSLLAMQQDVDKFRDRQAALERIELVEAAIEAARYQKAIEAFHKAKEEMTMAKAKAKALGEENEPTLQRITEMKAYRDELVRVVESRKQALTTADSAGAELLEKITEAENAVGEHDQEMKLQRDTYDKRRQGLAAKKAQITDLEAQRKQTPPEYDAAHWRSKIRAHRDRQAELTRENNDLLEKQRSITEGVRKAKKEFGDIRAEAAKMNTLLGKRENELRREDADAYKAWQWLNNGGNKSMFGEEVFGPPLLSCSMKDMRYADEVQVLIHKREMCSFIVQTQSDYDKLTNQLFKQQGLNFSVRTFSGKRADYPSPGRAQDFGFDGWAIDYLDGPELQLAYLCSAAQLHKIGVSRSDISPDQFRKLERQDQVMTWAAGKTLYKNVHRREYGDAGRSTSTRQIPQAAFWTDGQEFDKAVESQHAEQEQMLRRRVDEYKKQSATVQEELEVVAKAITQVTQDTERDTKTKDQLQRNKVKYDALPQAIKNAVSERDTLDRTVQELKASVNELASRRHDLLVEQARATLVHKNHLPVIWEAHQALVEAQILSIQAKSDVRSLEARNKAIVDQCAEERSLAEKAQREYKVHKAQARAQQETVSGIQAKHDDEEFINAFLAMGKERSVESLEAEAAAEKTTIEAMNIPFDTMENFKKFSTDKDHAEIRLARHKGKQIALQTEIEEVRSTWEPQVDELVSSVNDAFRASFERISCAGEVQLHKDEDFSKWAIRPMVSFR